MPCLSAPNSEQIYVNIEIQMTLNLKKEMAETKVCVTMPLIHFQNMMAQKQTLTQENIQFCNPSSL